MFFCKDWLPDDMDSHECKTYLVPLNFRKGDIIAAFEKNGTLLCMLPFFIKRHDYRFVNVIWFCFTGIMQGFLRGMQPQDGSVEQVIQEGQFPKSKVDEISGVQNYNNEFLWWTEQGEDDKQYIRTLYFLIINKHFEI